MNKYLLFIAFLPLLNLSCTEEKSSNVERDKNLKKEYWAAFIVPGESMKTDFIKFGIKYANWMYGYNVDPDKTVDLLIDIDTGLFGGEPINGTLTITNDSIKYEPQSMYKYLFKGIDYYKFPISDIVNVEIIESDAVVYKKRLRINTKNGSITLLRCRKYLADFHLSSGYEEKIRDLINQLIENR